MRLRQHGTWSASAATKSEAYARSKDDFAQGVALGDNDNAIINARARDWVAELLAHPNYRPAPVDDYFTSLAVWLAEDTRRTMSRRVSRSVGITLHKMNDGEVCHGLAWQHKPKPIPAVLQNLPKRPPRRAAGGESC